MGLGKIYWGENDKLHVYIDCEKWIIDCAYLGEMNWGENDKLHAYYIDCEKIKLIITDVITLEQLDID